MDDSSINPILLSSAAHLENVEQLIKNLEKNTLNVEDFGDILNRDRRHEIITKSFSAVSVNDMNIDDGTEDNFLVKSISLVNNGRSTIDDGSVSMDSLLNQRPLFDNDDYKKQQTPPGIDQSLFADQETAFTWDDQYDTRANYRLTFSTDKQQPTDQKSNKSHRHKNTHHKRRSNDSQSNSMCSDDGLPPNVTSHMTDWSMRSSTLQAFDQTMDQVDTKNFAPGQAQAAHVLRSQAQPNSSPPVQTTPVNNSSTNSSSTSSSSSASWKRNKETQRALTTGETKDGRTPSPLSLYKIFQQKNQMGASSTPRSAFQYYRQQADSVVPNVNDSMTISGEKLQWERSRTSSYNKKSYQAERRSVQTSCSSTDQAIQTSILVDSSANSPMTQLKRDAPKSGSYDHLATNVGSNSPNPLNAASRPSPAPISSSTIHKSLPDLAFISQYSKELPRSRTVSPAPAASLQNQTITPSPSPSPSGNVIPNKTESDRPRTLKSIKRYKNSKHSTEPLNVFYSPQLKKTFAAVPASAIIPGTNDAPTMIKMKLPPAAPPSGPNLKSCLKYGSRANSCDIQEILDDGKSIRPGSSIPIAMLNRDSNSPSSKRRCSETDAPAKRPDELFQNRPPLNVFDAFSNRDMIRDHYSEHDLAHFLQHQQQSQAKKSVSFSENIAKQLISPCNPAIKIDQAPTEFSLDHQIETNRIDDENLTSVLHGNRENSNRKPTIRYGEMRRCQTDVIVVDRIHHLHSFTESPPNEFRFQENESFLAPQSDDDDQAILEKTHVNILPETPPIDLGQKEIENEGKTSLNETINVNNSNSFSDKENEIPQQQTPMEISTLTMIPVDDPLLEGLLDKVANTVRRVFDIKRADKAFFLINNSNNQLDSLLKDELCVHLQFILEHGRKSQIRDHNMTRTFSLWEIIETSLNHGSSLQVFHDAKQKAQMASNYSLYKFQAFIFELVNKNELINWLYNFTKQKDILSRHYTSPDALILMKTDLKFRLFDRIMVQLEKLTTLAFRVTYQAPAVIPVQEFTNSTNGHGTTSRSSSRDWMRPIAKRTTRTVTQPIHPSSSVPATTAPTDTLKSTFTRKISALFNKSPTPQTQRKVSSAVTAKLPTTKTPSIRVTSPTVTRRGHLSNVFSNSPTPTSPSVNKPVIASSPKLSNGPRSSAIRRAISPTVIVAPSPPPALTENNAAFQSRIPRPSLNVDKPKSARYRSSMLPPK